MTALHRKKRKRDTRIVFYHNVKFKNHHGRKWHGACLDTEAQSTVIGREQAKAYYNYMGIDMNLESSENRYKLGNSHHKSLGTLPMKIPLGDKRLVVERVDVVKADVPFLVGLDFMDK